MTFSLSSTSCLLKFPVNKGTLAMMTAMARKTSLENIQLRNCDYFLIISYCSHSIMLTKYATRGLVCVPLN